MCKSNILYMFLLQAAPTTCFRVLSTNYQQPNFDPRPCNPSVIGSQLLLEFIAENSVNPYWIFILAPA